jgi:DNA-binding NarL/FixJ family response regulator
MPTETPGKLSPRETEVLLLIAKGLKNRQIGESLSISEQTVETHRKRIKKKLAAKRTNDLIAYVKENGLEPPTP